jgi:cardiolipin synthase
MHAGINIRVYDRTMLHAKIVTVDGVVASVGSANINQRSMQFDEELNLVIIDPDVVRDLDADFAADAAAGTTIDPEDWAARGPIQRAAERAVSVVADLI